MSTKEGQNSGHLCGRAKSSSNRINNLRLRYGSWQSYKLSRYDPSPVGRSRAWKNRFMMVIYKESKITPTFLCVTMQSRDEFTVALPINGLGALGVDFPGTAGHLTLKNRSTGQIRAGFSRRSAQKPGPLLKAFNMAKGRVSQGRSVAVCGVS